MVVGKKKQTNKHVSKKRTSKTILKRVPRWYAKSIIVRRPTDSAINYQEKKANQNHENLPFFHLIYICTFFNYEETKMIHKNPFNTSIKVRVKK